MKLSKNHNKHVLTLTEAELNAIRYSVLHTSLMPDIGEGPETSRLIRAAATVLKQKLGLWNSETFRSDMNAVGSGK